MANQAVSSAPNEVEIGLFLTGNRVVDQDICGQHPLFYGTVQLKDGIRRHAYVKAIPGRLIYAEVLTSLLGRSLGLPIPITVPAFARGSTLGIQADKVLCVASLDCGAAPIGRIARFDEVNSLLNRWGHARLAIVFDELIANGDRNLRNILLGSDGKLWLIDHEESLQDPLTAAHRQIRNHLLKKLSEDLSMFQLKRSAQLIGEKTLLLAGIDFAGHAEASLPSLCKVPESHVQTVIGFLRERINHLPRLIEVGLGLKQHHLELVNDKPGT